MIDCNAWGQHLPRDAVASLSHSLMQFAMPTAFAQEFPTHFQGRFDSNLMGPGNARLLESSKGNQILHQSCVLLPMHIERQTIDP